MNIIILGGAGFIGSHTGKRLKSEGHWVVSVDIKTNEYMQDNEFCSEFIQGDLRDPVFVHEVFDLYLYDEVYQYAADMGGAGYIFTGENDANVMHNSAVINLNVAYEASMAKVGRLFYSSSACCYPGFTQEEFTCNECCREDKAYPSQPDSEYGWEKLFSERLYKAFERNYGLQVRIARFHNIFGPQSVFKGGKEKAPAAICRKVVQAQDTIEIWGTGEATRSFLYVDECVEGVIKLMRSDCTDIVNIGSEESISINDLAKMVIGLSGKKIEIKNIEGPVGVNGRNSHNELIYSKLGWKPTQPLQEGIEKLYNWVNEQVNGS